MTNGISLAGVPFAISALVLCFLRGRTTPSAVHNDSCPAVSGAGEEPGLLDMGLGGLCRFWMTDAGSSGYAQTGSLTPMGRLNRDSFAFFFLWPLPGMYCANWLAMLTPRAFTASGATDRRPVSGCASRSDW